MEGLRGCTWLTNHAYNITSSERPNPFVLPYAAAQIFSSISVEVNVVTLDFESLNRNQALKQIKLFHSSA